MIHPKKKKFKFQTFRRFNNIDYYIYNTNSPIYSEKFILKIFLKDSKKIFESKIISQNLKPFKKNGENYLQQEFNFSKHKLDIILRFTLKLKLREIICKRYT